MKYNSERKDLRIPEYGRHIQDMADHIVAIEDKEERTKAAFSLVKIMGQINPLVAGLEGGDRKLWDQLHLISDFKLEVDAPYPKPEQDKYKMTPDLISYSESKKMRYRHYGQIIPNFIAHAKELEENEEKQALTQSIANLMKKAYLNWNRDNVDDELIVEQLEKISDGKLKLDKTFELDRKNDLLVKQPQNNAQKKKPGKRNKNYRYKKKA